MAASELERLQYWLSEQIRKRRALPKDAGVAEQAALELTGNAYLAPVEQLEIYREQFWLRHTGSLVEDFPGIGGILGQADWDRLIQGYLECLPPRSFTLRDLGDRLADYIRESAEWLEQRELAADMARLEWAFVEIFDAADAPPLDPQKLATLAPEAWETARIVLSPALRLISVRYPVAELRRALMRAAASDVAQGTQTRIPIPEASPERLVLYRNFARALCFRAVAEPEFLLLETLGHGTPLGLACEHVALACPGTADTLERELAAWFRAWGERHWVVDVISGAP